MKNTNGILMFNIKDTQEDYETKALVNAIKQKQAEGFKGHSSVKVENEFAAFLAKK